MEWDALRRERAELELRSEIAERYRAVLEALAEGVVVLDADGRVTEANTQAAALLGRSLEELIGSIPRLEVNPVYEDETPMLPGETLTQRVLRTGEPVTGEIIGISLPDGLRRWLSVNARRTSVQDPGRDMAVVCTIADVTERQELIHELSTPTLRVGERLLVMPLIGRLDAARAEHLTGKLLDGIRQSRAQVAILDLTGVPAIDSSIADNVLATAEAARLMGARVIVTGLNAEAAATLADLNVDLGTITTIGDLQDGIQEGQRILRQRQTGSLSAP